MIYRPEAWDLMDMFQDLLTSSSAPRVAPETLEMIGRQASQMFREHGVPLNDAIRQLAAQHPELGNEHIKRVVEFANNVTFQEMFQSSPDKNIHFEVADPGVVLRDLKDGGSPAHDGKTLQGGMGDYKTSPSSFGNKGVQAGLDDELSNLFQHRPADQGGGDVGQVKMAHTVEDHTVHANPVEDVYDAHVRLQASKRELENAGERFDLLVKEAHEGLYHLVKHEVLDPNGAGIGGVLHVLSKVASADLVHSVIGPMVKKLASEGVSREQLNMSLEKRAGKVVNMNHPLIQTWSGMMKAAEEKVKTEEALEEIGRSLIETDRFLKTSGDLATGIKKAVGPRGRVPSGLRQRFPRK